MVTRDARIDAYIEHAREFARPILRHLRDVVHAGCPDATETIKWGSPHFEHRGLLCGMAAFKEHCAFGFWRYAEVVPKEKSRADEAMGVFGRLRTVSDLPSRSTLLAYVRKAARLNESGVKPARRATTPKPAVRPPKDLLVALAKAPKARATFDGLSPSHRREYVEWITEAKGADTRSRRLATTVEWLAEGKSRNWKYAKR